MAGLLSDVLPFLYAQGDRAKRHVRSLLSDPLGSLEQTAGGIQDAHRAQLGLLARAFPDEKQPFKVADQSALGQATQNMLTGPLGFAPAGITAWHGSPHIFDKFDSSKIGTGEGAQAYGHGLYLAEAPEVAKQYADTLGATRASYLVSDGRVLKPDADIGIMLDDIAKGRPAQEWATLRGVEKEDPSLVRAAEIAKSLIGKQLRPMGAGSLYKVDLPDSAVARMLDWDKPLSQQPEAVRKAALQIDPSLPTKAFPVGGQLRPAMEQSGSELIESLGRTHADRLRELGIPGIRYLDGGSRGAGHGTANYVVFPGEESLLKILERNGAPVR